MATRPEVTQALIDGHPVTGAYSADDIIAQAEMTALNIDGPPDIQAMINYLMTERHRGSAPLGRIMHLCNKSIGDIVPYDNNDGDITLTLEHITSAHAFMYLLGLESLQVSLTDSNLQLVLTDLAGGANNAGAISNGDKNALLAMSTGQLAHVAGVSVTDIRDSRP